MSLKVPLTDEIRPLLWRRQAAAAFILAVTMGIAVSNVLAQTDVIAQAEAPRPIPAAGSLQNRPSSNLFWWDLAGRSCGDTVGICRI